MSSKVIVGRYELLEKIGDGGMAVVYKAKDRLLNRLVAVKILKPEYTNDEKFINNFRKESHAAASLSHPNIVSIYDVGKEGNINYIVMELVEGRPLSKIIKDEAPLNYNRVIDLSKQIASGLSAAHKHGIIHRDVKPHNILVNEDGIAKIADFGIAKAISTTTIIDGTNDTIMGSVHYFSPEQARGGYVDEKSDIYSLGIVMYEMLTGQVPFDGDNPVTVALMHINDQMTPPSQLATGIPPGLERIVVKATDKYQSNRFKSADDVITALDNLELVGRVVGQSMFVNQEPERPPMPAAPSPSEEIAAKAAENEVVERKTKGKKKIVIAIILVLALLAGLAIAAYSMGLIGPKDIRVPNLEGSTVEEAQEKLEKIELKLEVVEYEKSDKYEAGEIISQDPVKGTKVRKNAVVEVIVSKGSDEALVPNVVGKTEEEATNILDAAGYTVKVREKTSTKPKGEVLEQDPSAGVRLKKGETVTITISDGKGVEKVTVPSLLGLPADEARAKLESAGLKAGMTAEDYSDTYAKGKIMSQEEEAGTKVEKGSAVGFTVSKGPRSSEGRVKLFVDYTDAKNDVFYMTVTVSDEDGTRNVVSNQQCNKEEEGTTLNIDGKGTGTITVIFDNETVMRRNVDFATGEMS